MSTYEVDYSVLLPEFGALNIEADSPDDAELEAIKQLKDMYPDARNIEIEMVRLING